MKKTITSLISITLIVLMLLSTACTNSGNASETGETSVSESESTVSDKADTSGTESESESESETETEPQTEYTDLSASFSPLPRINTKVKVKTSTVGSSSGGDLVLEFDGNESSYNFASFGIDGFHDSHLCDNCKYEEKNGANAFHLCDHSGEHSGITVMLKTPIKASLFSGIKVTFMTADEIKNVSQIRILKPDSTSVSDIVNHSGCPDISGATEDWKTVDFGLNASHS